MSRRSPHVGIPGRSGGPANSGNSNDLNAGNIVLPNASSSAASNMVNEAGIGHASSPLVTQFGERLHGGKRPIALNGIGATVDRKVVDLLCPICFELITEAHITKCGHTFCYRCVLKSIEIFKRCPKCSTSMESQDQLIPNYLLDELIAKHRMKAQIQERLFGTPNSGTALPNSSNSSSDTPDVLDHRNFLDLAANADGLRGLLTTESQKLSLPDVKAILDILSQRKQMLEAETSIAQNRLLGDFLNELLQQTEKKREQIDQQIVLIKKDLAVVGNVCNADNENRSNRNAPAGVSSVDSSDVAMSDNDLVSTQNSTPSSRPDGGLNADDGFNSLRNGISNQTYLSRKRRMYAHFDDFVSSYFTIRRRELLFGTDTNGDIADGEQGDTSTLSSPSQSTFAENSNTKRPRNTLAVFRENLVGFSKYNSLRPLATMHYSSDLHNNSTIVSTIVFDKDNEFFAIGGVTRRIKVFDYLAVVRDTVDIHYPNVEMVSNSKISCITWNSFYKYTMASSDYEGAINIYDTQSGTRTKVFHEHEKRCWSVDFNSVDSRMVASGSDDARVKLWSINDEHSVATLEAKANVCCVKFNPKSSCHLAFGSADHDVHYYDLRNMNTPLCVFKGHKKAVSYVKFLNTNEIISASTDSQLKLWNVNEPPNCLRSFVGHVNEKNFVGLSTDGDYIACGSEDNSLYVYYKGLSKPLFSYRIDASNAKFGANGTAGRGGTLQPNDSDRFTDVNEFVSAVCFRKQCNVVLAANSKGIIKVLELI